MGAVNAPTALASAVDYTEASPQVQVLGAHVDRSLDSLSAHSTSISPVSLNSFQSYAVETTTDAPVLEVGLRGVGGHFRLSVDGSPTSTAPAPSPSGGGFYRLTVRFAARAPHTVRLQTDESRFTQFTVSSTDTVSRPAAPARRAVVLGDSYAEGTGADARFTSFGQSLCARNGWDDCWVAGSGGTGYLSTGAATSPPRTTFRGRVVNDVVQWHPDVVVVAGGRNDYAFTVAQEQAEATALYQQLRSALPSAQIITTSLFPASTTEANDPHVVALSAALQAAGSGLVDRYLDVVGTNSYLTSANVGALVGPDGVHPTQAGHDELARQLTARLTQP
jgi:lysophospholipase L1-like esterase